MDGVSKTTGLLMEEGADHGTRASVVDSAVHLNGDSEGGGGTVAPVPWEDERDEGTRALDEAVAAVFDAQAAGFAGGLPPPKMLWGIRVFVIRCLFITGLTSILLG